jgi:hypothetical protein
MRGWMMVLVLLAGMQGGYVTYLAEGFEGVEQLVVPAGWTIAETNGKGTPGVWRVADDPDSPGAPRILRLVETRNTGQTYNLLLSEARFPPNLSLSCVLRADSGEEDRGGGLAWQVQDENNYFVTRWNPLEKNVRIYKVTDGERALLFGSSVNVSARGWHTLQVSVRGPSIAVQLDDHITITCLADPFPDGGRIGFWTKADAATSFDLLHVRREAR